MTESADPILAATAEAAGTIREIAIEAGKRIMEVYALDFDVMVKDDSSPLTEADLASHRTIVEGLSTLPETLSGLPLVSEEAALPSPEECRGWNAWWLIDPLDGTKEFVKKNGEFTVNIALIQRPAPGEPGVPSAGWVYAPVPDTLYEGISCTSALRIDGAGSDVPGDPHPLPVEPAGTPPRIVASRSHRSPETDIVIDAIGEAYGRGDIVSSGSSLKLCRVAEGSAELYPRCAPTSEWDTAAADAVCRAAGARVVRASDGTNLEYGKDNILNPWFLVCAEPRLLEIAVGALIC